MTGQDPSIRGTHLPKNPQLRKYGKQRTLLLPQLTTTYNYNHSGAFVGSSYRTDRYLYKQTWVGPTTCFEVADSPKVITSMCVYVSAKLHTQYSIRWSETIMQNKWGATDVRESPFVSGITTGTADFREITSVSSIEPSVVWLFCAEDQATAETSSCAYAKSRRPVIFSSSSLISRASST